jgi:trigger factor
VNINVEALEDNKVKISVEVEASDINARIKRAYKDAAKKYKFPGFRPGKAPRPIIDSAFGGPEYIRSVVTEDVVNYAYPLACEENDLVALFKPEYTFGTEDDLVVEGQPFTFDAVIAVKPSFELNSYEPVEIEMPSTEATEAEIDAQLEELRNYYPEFEDANANTKVKPGQVVVLTSTVTDADGKVHDTLCMSETQYELGTGLYPEIFDAELIGLKKGGEKEFDVDFTDDNSMVASILGDDRGLMHFSVKVDAIKKKVIPEATDEWAANFGMESVEAMRTALAEQIQATKAESEPRRKENECLAAVAARLEGELPENLCEIEEANLLQSFFQQLQQQGLTFDSYLQAAGIDQEQFKADTKEQAADLVRQDLALDAWARHFDIEASDEEVTHEFELADVEDSAATQKEWLEAGRLPEVREGIKRSKAMLDIVEKAVVTLAEAPKAEEAEAAADADAE